MRLVDDDEIDLTQLACPLIDGLDARHGDGILEVASLQASGVDAHRQIGGDRLELLCGLFEQFLDVR